mmetsp:Transcript_14348/g.19799  ORF Transcript_14348/g.19799 Transcript_14348/m.19799 type:complete len:547 (-) Transcript_14348:336-1976(-)
MLTCPKSDEPHPLCFICFDTESDDENERDRQLVSPCACRGSAAWVHVGCLKKWHLKLGVSTHLLCPTCKQAYVGDVAEELARLNLSQAREKDQLSTHSDNTKLLYECSALDQLGQVLSSQGKYDEALDLFKRSLENKVSIMGEERPTVANSLDNIAEVYRTRGQYESALGLKKEALRIRKKVLGLNHTDTATSYNNIGLVLQNMGKLAQAKPYFKKAVFTYEQLCPNGTTNLASMLNNLAGSYRFQGNTEKAEKLYRRSLAMRIRVLGPDRPAVAESLNNLAMVLKDAGKFEEAEDLSSQCLNLAKKLFEGNQPGFLNYLGNYGIVLLAMDKPAEESRSYITRALEGLRANNFPETHVWIQKFQKHIIQLDEEKLPPSSRLKRIFSWSDRRPSFGDLRFFMPLISPASPKKDTKAHMRSISNCRPTQIKHSHHGMCKSSSHNQLNGQVGKLLLGSLAETSDEESSEEEEGESPRQLRRSPEFLVSTTRSRSGGSTPRSTTRSRTSSPRRRRNAGSSLAMGLRRQVNLGSPLNPENRSLPPIVTRIT